MRKECSGRAGLKMEVDVVDVRGSYRVLLRMQKQMQAI